MIRRGGFVTRPFKIHPQFVEAGGLQTRPYETW
jgi:hypothetical protein